ncbi:MAG: hypothetical protein L6R37_002366 [Teloschistes peruensis]|nr:MAG: hypothetical protein L6R37_002366 [Teloschistes peruensis]
MPGPLTPPKTRPRNPPPLIMEGRYPAFPLPPRRHRNKRNDPHDVEYPELDSSSRHGSRHASTSPSSPGSFVSAMTDSEGGDSEGGDSEGGNSEGGDSEGGDSEGGDSEGGDLEGGDLEGGD